MQEVYRFGHRLFIGSKVCFYNFTAIKGRIYRRKRSAQISQFFKVIPHNSKCRYGERGAADANWMSYRAFWQRRCRAAAVEAVLKPLGGNCAVLP